MEQEKKEYYTDEELEKDLKEINENVDLLEKYVKLIKDSED